MTIQLGTAMDRISLQLSQDSFQECLAQSPAFVRPRRGLSAYT